MWCSFSNNIIRSISILYVQSWSLITLLAIGAFVLNLTILVIIDRFLILWIKLKYLWYIKTLIIAIFVLLKA